MRPCKILAFCAGTLLASTAALAQCPNLTWTGQFATPALGLVQSSGTALQVFDPDGPGPIPAELYVGGYFTTAGGIPTTGIARWNGSRWAAVGGGVGFATGFPSVTGLGIHDADGPGPQLPLLIVAGSFDSAGGVPVTNFAAWNGSQWAPFGTEITSVLGTNVAFAEYDPDGSGPALPTLVAAGRFEIGGSTYASILKWDGANWSVFLPGISSVFALAVFDEDGPGHNPPYLFAGSDDLPGITRWDGASRSTVGGGLTRSAIHLCSALRVVDEDGAGPGRPVLFVGGSFSGAGTVSTPNIVRWDGQNWSAIGAGVAGQVEDILALDDPTGAGGPPSVYITTSFGNRLYRWAPTSQQWTQIGSASAYFNGFTLYRLAAFDDDASGPMPPSVYFTAPSLGSVNNSPSYGIARYGCTSCYPNCDGSVIPPSLNVSDFICFLNRFAAGESYANCDASTNPPIMNVNDFTCFLNRYGAGCP